MSWPLLSEGWKMGESCLDIYDNGKTLKLAHNLWPNFSLSPMSEMLTLWTFLKGLHEEVLIWVALHNTQLVAPVALLGL